MFGKGARSWADDPAEGPPRRRATRGLGPFSGGQLTTIIVVIVIAVVLPVGAWAVSGTTVFVTDGTSGVKAKVTSTGQLQTHNNGTQTVSGTVTEASPSALVTEYGLGFTQGSCVNLFAPPTGKALVLKSANLEWLSMTPGSGGIVIFRDSSCSQVVGEYPATTANGSMQVSFGAGVTVKNGQSFSMIVYASSGVAGVQAYGYTVPSSAVPLSAAPRTTQSLVRR